MSRGGSVQLLGVARAPVTPASHSLADALLGAVAKNIPYYGPTNTPVTTQIDHKAIADHKEATDRKKKNDDWWEKHQKDVNDSLTKQRKIDNEYRERVKTITNSKPVTPILSKI